MNPNRSECTPRIVKLADQLARDIAGRGLREGEEYLNTAEAARFLGVGTATANRAMQLLVRRRLLTRSQGRGTLIADPDTGERPEFACVHLLVRKDYSKREGLLADGVVVGLQGELPDTQMQFSFLPEADPGDFVAKLIRRAARASEPQAFILVRSSLAAQRELEQSGMPAVVYGSLYPSIRRLPSLDRDNHPGGRLLAEYVLSEAQRLVVLLRDRSFAGDFAFLDGILDAATDAGLAPNDVMVRHMPVEEQAVSELLQSLANEQRIGVICRSQPLGETTVEAISHAPAAVDRTTRIAVSDVYQHNKRTTALAHLKREVAPEEIGRRLGRLLLNRVAGEEPTRELIPVCLVTPVNGAGASPPANVRRSHKSQRSGRGRLDRAQNGKKVRHKKPSTG